MRHAAEVAAEALEGGGALQRAAAVEEWWAAREVAAAASLLRLDHRQLRDLRITSDTARALRLRTVKVQPVHQVSVDGVSYPSAPAELRAEIWRQAKELYTCRAGIPVEYDVLLRGAALLGPTTPDQLDFFTYMQSLLQFRCWEPPLQYPPKGSELQPLVSHGSKATALDELPRVVLAHLGGLGLQLVADMVRRSMGGEMSVLLGTAIHIPLRKKDPSWLLQNSRPVILEACCRRVAATAIYRRLMCHMESRHHLPSAMLAYRRQTSNALAVGSRTFSLLFFPVARPLCPKLSLR